MATAHAVLTKSVSRSGLDDQENKALIHILRRAIPNRVVATANQTVAGTTLTASTGLAIDQGFYLNGGAALQANSKYHVKGTLYCLGVTSNGIKLDLGGGTATVTSGTQINYKILTASTVADSNVTSLTSTASVMTVVTKVEIDGYLVCNGSGTLVLRFAEQANSTGVVVYAGSWLEVSEALN